MIPILYSTSETSFTSNGLGRLTDCISCLVTEERNGIFECEFQYPITGKLYNEMVTNGGIISVTHDDAKDRQPFDIYKYSAPIDGIVTFNARHISYRLSGITVKPFTAASCALALQGIGTNSLSTNQFSFWTDKAVTSTFTLSVPTSAKAILAGQQGSILDVYGKGEYKFDKFDVKLYTNRGTNSGVTIRYGKNLSDTLVEKDNGEYYNAIVPYWKGEDGTLVTLTGWYVVQTGETLKYCVPVDFSSEFQSQPTELELRTKAAAYLANNTPWLPKENIKVDFVQLWNTDEYKNVAVLERVKLCDTVAIYYPALGLTNSSAKVIKVVYDTLLERYTSIELGEPQQTLSEAIMQPYAQAIASISDKASVSFMEEAIQAATDLITGGLGGHVVINRNANGEPEEILIMDTDDTSTAVNVWRWNLNGLAHSHSGYNGPFDDIAITQDGKINASMITTGVINANLITAGTITADKLDANNINSSKTLTVGALTDAAAATVLNSNIQIGGRNLAMGTATPKTVTTIANRTWYLPPVYSISAYGATAIADTNNTQVTISFDYTITGVDTAFTLVSCLKETSSAWGNGITFNSVPVGNSSGHAEGTKDLTAGERQYAGTDGILFSGSGNANANSVLTVSNLKVEIGNKATTWTQAPEDVAADIATAQSTAEGANSQEQLIYISRVSGTTTQSATTTWITDTTGNQNTWTIKRPVYNSSYPVLFVATQRKSVGGTVTCTTPQIDQTTTVIDGGHITTGTIDAGVVNVTNINASNITSGTMSASKISGGTLSLGGQNNTNGQLYIYDANGVLCGKIDNTGIEEYGDVGGYTQKLSIGAGYLTLSYAGFVLGVLNAGSSGGTHGGTLSLLGSSGYTRAYLSAVSGALYLNDASGNSGIELNGASGIAWIRGLGANAGRGSLSIYGSQQTGYDENGMPIYVDSAGHRYQYFVDSSGHIATDLGRDTTRSFLTLNSPDGSSDIFLDTLPANGSRFNSPVYTNAGLTTTDATVNGVLDVTQRRCHATLSSAGWYRVLKVNANNSAIAKGYTGQIIDINVSRRSDTTYGELHKISFMNYLDSGTFANESSISGSLNIDKIRYTYDATQGIGYIDIRYNTSTSNGVTIDFDVHTWQLSKGLYVSTNPTKVVDSPSGETVLTEYTFAANTEYTRYIWTPTFSGTANPSVNNASCFYSVKNGVLYAGGRFNLASFTSGGTTVSFTLPVSLGSADRSAETIGTMFTTTKTLQLRWTGATVYITDAGGNFSGDLLNTGYWSFQIVAPIYN